MLAGEGKGWKGKGKGAGRVSKGGTGRGRERVLAGEGKKYMAGAIGEIGKNMMIKVELE